MLSTFVTTWTVPVCFARSSVIVPLEWSNLPR